MVKKALFELSLTIEKANMFPKECKFYVRGYVGDICHWFAFKTKATTSCFEPHWASHFTFPPLLQDCKVHFRLLVKHDSQPLGAKSMSLSRAIAHLSESDGRSFRTTLRLSDTAHVTFSLAVRQCTHRLRLSQARRLRFREPRALAWAQRSSAAPLTQMQIFDGMGGELFLLQVTKREGFPGTGMRRALRKVTVAAVAVATEPEAKGGHKVGVTVRRKTIMPLAPRLASQRFEVWNHRRKKGEAPGLLASVSLLPTVVSEGMLRVECADGRHFNFYLAPRKADAFQWSGHSEEFGELSSMAHWPQLVLRKKCPGMAFSSLQAEPDCDIGLFLALLLIAEIIQDDHFVQDYNLSRRRRRNRRKVRGSSVAGMPLMVLI